MHISVLYFAGAKEAAGTPSEELPLAGDTLSLSELSRMLVSRHPRLVLDGVRFAINEEFSAPDQLIFPGDVVAVIPPVSGG
jgi:molybdopterin converting factor subunit 1